MKRIHLFLVALLVMCLSLSITFSRQALASESSPGYEYFVVGNPGDVTILTSPGLVLMGGNTDVDSAFQWMINKSGGGDFVVIRAGGTDAYNPWIYYDLGGVDSVETLIIKMDRGAYDPFVIQKIRNAEALWIAGGNQWDYVRMWKGTPVEDAIQYVAAKGAPVGGTSAGLAVLGEFIFSAEHGTIKSADALKNPYNPRVALARDFLSLPNLQGVITDSHFAERDRMGRLMVFLSRILKDNWAEEARGIGVDGKTALVVEPNGRATLHGTGSVYFLSSTIQPEVCIPSKPLTFRNVSVYRLTGAGSIFNLSTWRGSSGTEYQLSVVDGELFSTQEGGSIY